MERKLGLDGFVLKMFMAALMLLDHLYYFLPEHGFPIWFTMAGRLVAPTFCFLMTQSLRYTRNRSRYIHRMTIAGLVMQVGSMVVMVVARLLVGGSVPVIGNTIFLSLAVSAALVDRLEYQALGKPSAKNAGIIVLLLVVSLFLEGGFLIPALAAIFYFLWDRKMLMSLVYLTGGTLAAGLLMGFGQPNPAYAFQLLGLTLHTQYLQVFALIPILLYNGRPGVQGRFSKWFFYAFYPLHIWILYLMGVLG